MGAKLAGKVAVVTGAARGLGQAYARRLAEDGADLCLADVRPMTETEGYVKETGRQVLSSRTDVTVPEQVDRFAEDAMARFGRCDIIVNNAGIWKFQSFGEMSYDDWREVLATDLDALFIVTKAFLGPLKRSGSGRVINVTSNTVWTVKPSFAHYIAAKAGVVGLTRALATELADFNVTVNCIAPSLTRTPGTEQSPAKDLFDKYPEMQAIHRLEEPRDVVGTVSFLASEDAAFITGQTISVDGGMVRL